MKNRKNLCFNVELLCCRIHVRNVVVHPKLFGLLRVRSTYTSYITLHRHGCKLWPHWFSEGHNLKAVILMCHLLVSWTKLLVWQHQILWHYCVWCMHVGECACCRNIVCVCFCVVHACRWVCVCVVGILPSLSIFPSWRGHFLILLFCLSNAAPLLSLFTSLQMSLRVVSAPNSPSVRSQACLFRQRHRNWLSNKERK